MATDERFGILLGRYRNDYGWSQSDLANKIRVHRNTIALWESGERSPQFRGEVLRLADELHLSKEERKAFLLAANFTAERWPVEFWNVPHHQKPFFTGREALLDSLHTELVPGGRTTALTQAISGLGGIGKTQVAVEYAHRYAYEYEAVFWLQADSWERVTAECLRLATTILGLPEQSEAEKQVEEVKRWLQTHRGWLLILDNVEEPQQTLPRFLPTKHQGSVLMTTRRRDVAMLALNVILPVFSRYESVLFLLRRAGKIGPQASLRMATHEDIRLAKELSMLLGGLPLALDQAGAYVAENGRSLQRYLDRYQHYRPRLLDRRETTDHPDSVLMTFWLSWEQIQERNVLAGKMLQFCAFLAPDQIPEQLMGNATADAETGSTSGALEMDEALGLLHRYSLVERGEQTLSLHRLVQEVIQDVLPEEERQQWMGRAIQAVNALFPSGEHGTWSLCELLLPHALTCAKWTLVLKQKTLEELRLLGAAGRYLYERAEYREAELLYERALAIAEEHSGASHPDTATSLNNLAELYQTQGRYREAELFYQRALLIYEQQLGGSHPDTATTLNNVAEFYRVQGRYREAEPLYQRALHIREELFGTSHPNTGTSMNNLALLYWAQGRYREAEPLLQRALSIVQKQFGNSHPHMATALNNLAGLYDTQGRYREAEPLYQRALLIREEQVGAFHPDTATSMNNLAFLYQVQSRYAEAEPLLKRALLIAERQLGNSHPQTAMSLNNLAGLYWEQGQYAEAEPILKRALLIREEQLGASHPDTATTLNNLAELYRAQGRYAEAEPLLKRGLRITEEQLGTSHPDTATGLNNVAELYQTQGRYAEAEPLLRQALLIYEQQLEAPHPNMMVCLNNLAELYRVQGRYGEAEPLLMRAVKGSIASLGMQHPQTRQIIANHLTLLSHLHTNGDIEALIRLFSQEK